jgi:D-serine deaminase-like pyridoxal phosphate-dependent protein
VKIVRPTLLLDEAKCKKNIQRMAEKARRYQLVFRPHFKTHQSATIGEWFRELGVERITVSSVTMAEYFARSGWTDILIAFPVNLLEIDQINNLNDRIDISLLLESKEAVEFLNINLRKQAGFYIKIDTGNHRTGIAWNDTKEIERILKEFDASKLKFIGFLTHSGHTYQAKSRREIQEIHNDSVGKLNLLKSRFSRNAIIPILSVGDTPSCSIAENFEGIDEIRPGNFIFYDVTQYHLGSCEEEDIAVALACPVVAKHPDRNEFVIYGGAIHLSKEFITDFTGKRNYGQIVNLQPANWSNPIERAFVKSLSQEHGVIQTTKEHFKSIKIGDVIAILPVHSCLTSSQMKHYFTLNGKRLNKMH